MMAIIAVTTVLLGATLAWLVAVLAGAAGFVYLALFLLAAVPGLPVGFALFGRRHGAAWIAGVPIGYAMTALACWAVVFVRIPSTPAFLLAWALVSASGLGRRGHGGARQLLSSISPRGAPPTARRCCWCCSWCPRLSVRPFCADRCNGR